MLRLTICCWLLLFSGAVAEPLPGTAPLTMEGDIPRQLLDGAHRFADRETALSVERRSRHWKRDFSSPEAYEKSIQPNRERLANILGVELRPTSTRIHHELESTTPLFGHPDVSQGPGFDVLRVRWPVVANIHAEGIYLRPQNVPMEKCVVFLFDADFSTQQLQERNYALRFIEWFNVAERYAASGIHVFIPQLINRSVGFRSLARGRTDLTDREYIYRQAFEMGRHIIGYEVQTVRSLIDVLDGRLEALGVLGFGNGGALALYAGALDTRIDVIGVSSVFDSRQNLWQEPIDCNVWGRLDEFGDAEIASLIAPRSLVIDFGQDLHYSPRTFVPPADILRIAGPGQYHVPNRKSAFAEVERVRQFTRKSGMQIITTDYAVHSSGKEATFIDVGFARIDQERRLERVLIDDAQKSRSSILARLFSDQSEIISQWTDFTQSLVQNSEKARVDNLYEYYDPASRDYEKFAKSTRLYRDYLYEEVIGRFDYPLEKPNPRTRQVYDEEKYRGYEVVLDVFSDVIAYGVLLLPKDLKPGEKRPVVVCQHGLEGRPQDTIEANQGERYYHRFAARLAERGFITFAPQNLYIFKNDFRQLQRKLNPLKKSLYSIIIPQHQQICDWLAALPMVDADRIAFYGLSYGGKTAMRVPPLVDRYCAVICSGDFNEWIVKTTSVRHKFSYVGTGEYEIWEWNLGNTFNYAELAGLIAPRPFMVERGHRDGVGLDSFVAYEYAKVQLLYADLKIPERTEIEYFDGPHEIHAVGTFKFLHKHLNWPEPPAGK